MSGVGLRVPVEMEEVVDESSGSFATRPFMTDGVLSTSGQVRA